MIRGAVDLAPVEVNRPGRNAMPYSHIELLFAHPVRGPIAIGSGQAARIWPMRAGGRKQGMTLENRSASFVAEDARLCGFLPGNQWSRAFPLAAPVSEAGAPGRPLVQRDRSAYGTGEDRLFGRCHLVAGIAGPRSSS